MSNPNQNPIHRHTAPWSHHHATIDLTVAAHRTPSITTNRSHARALLSLLFRREHATSTSLASFEDWPSLALLDELIAGDVYASEEEGCEGSSSHVGVSADDELRFAAQMLIEYQSTGQFVFPTDDDDAEDDDFVPHGNGLHNTFTSIRHNTLQSSASNDIDKETRSTTREAQKKEDEFNQNNVSLGPFLLELRMPTATPPPSRSLSVPPPVPLQPKNSSISTSRPSAETVISKQLQTSCAAAVVSVVAATSVRSVPAVPPPVPAPAVVAVVTPFVATNRFWNRPHNATNNNNINSIDVNEQEEDYFLDLKQPRSSNDTNITDVRASLLAAPLGGSSSSDQNSLVVGGTGDDSDVLMSVQGNAFDVAQSQSSHHIVFRNGRFERVEGKAPVSTKHKKNLTFGKSGKRPRDEDKQLQQENPEVLPRLDARKSKTKKVSNQSAVVAQEAEEKEEEIHLSTRSAEPKPINPTVGGAVVVDESNTLSMDSEEHPHHHQHQRPNGEHDKATTDATVSVAEAIVSKKAQEVARTFWSTIPLAKTGWSAALVEAVQIAL